MKVFKLNSQKEVSIKVSDYLINWNSPGASKLEKQFKQLIKPFWSKYIVLEQFRIPGSLLRLDFLNLNLRLCAEINGVQHENFNKFFHNNSRTNYLASIKRDILKSDWLEKNNIKLISLNQEDLDNFSYDYIYKKFNISLI